MKRLFLLAIICVFTQTIPQAQTASIMGFSKEAAATQQKLEQQFDQKLKPENLDSWMKRLSARPHYVGTEYGKENAEFMAAQFRSWGYEVEIAEYHVLFPTPKLRELELVAPTTYKAMLVEPPVEGDATSTQTSEHLASYNCYSADGDVTAELVFVNYGLPEDYDQLAKMGIDVKGKIVITKYGRSWRGIKPKVAAEKGAIGCLIYSDPADDGYSAGDVYPKGPFKNEYGVQRGSVMDMPLYPGDPLTPTVGATKDAKRLELDEAITLMKIPVLPISYKDAQPLLEALGGPVPPRDWQGGLPMTYHVGPGPAKVHLKLEFNWDIKPAYNVIATMKGSELPDEWIIRGNHHDAWVNGANDPISGLVALMEEARAIGELAKAGQRPKRTIIYCAWDAEEPGLLGSTEWVEDHAKELKEKAVAYINSDSNGRGFLFAGGSHTLEKFFNEVAASVTDPQTKLTVLERRKAKALVDGADDFKRLKLSALGSGSDYSPFIQHLGIPSMNIGFGGESSGGEYHSVYDSYEHYIRFKDIDFQYGIAFAKIAGHATLRLANANVLPFEFDYFYETINGYAREVMELADRMRRETNKENRLIREGHYAAAADPTKTFIVPQPKENLPYLNFAPLQNALADLEQQIKTYQKKADTLPKDSKTEKLNKLLYQAEQALLLEKGLPGRPWYKHHIYAPGFYTGYGVKTLPGVREAIEQRDWELAQEQIEALAEVLKNYGKVIEEAAKVR